MLRLFRFSPLLIAFAIVTSTITAQAGLIVTINATQGSDIPDFDVTNISGQAMTDFEVTIGDTTFNYDGASIRTPPPGNPLGATLQPPSDPNLNNGPVGASDTVHWAFTNFQSGDTFKFRTEVDPDGLNQSGDDYTTVLFNNGAAPNAKITATFADGSTAVLTFPDVPGASWTDGFTLTCTPEPTSFAAYGAIGLGLMYYRRRRNARKQLETNEDELVTS